MQTAELQKMTVLQLRKVAKDNGVKLSAGIDKDGIVARIAQALGAEAPAQASQSEDSPAPAKRGRPKANAQAGNDVEAADSAASAGAINSASTRNVTASPTRSDLPHSGLTSDLASEVVRDLEKLQEAPVSADVTSVEPGGFRPIYRQAWQARSTTPREPGQKPAWSQPSRGPANRFGPPVSAQPKPPEEIPAPPSMPERPAYAEQPKPPIPDNAPKLDGYRLGYRAAPQRAPYQSRGDYGYQQGGYRQNNYGYQQRGYQQQGYQQGYQQSGYRAGGYNNYQQQRGYQPPVPDLNPGDSVYRMQRDPQFTEQAENGQLPELLQVAEGEPAAGVLEILPDGYGFMRGSTLLPGKKDIYVSMAQVRRYGLRTGDYLEGKARAQRMSDKFAALLVVEKVNGHEPEENPDRLAFDQLVPVYPTRRIVLENEQNAAEESNMVIRLVDLIAPIGFGQRAMIVCPPDCQRLHLLQSISSAIKRNDPDAEVLMLLIDIAPEEVTEIREGADAEVFATTFADAPETQTRVSETMLERAMRLVEEGRNVVILLDSLTKLTRAYQAALVQGGRPISNTVTPAALVRPKRFFGAARNTRDAGSLTVVATIAVDTGSRVDDIVFEEFKGTANMELFLCSSQPGDPISPMLDLQMSGTKKDDMLLNDEQKEGLRAIRKVLGSATNGEAVVQLIDMMRKTKCNADLLSRLKDWIVLWEKSGYLKR